MTHCTLHNADLSFHLHPRLAGKLGTGQPGPPAVHSAPVAGVDFSATLLETAGAWASARRREGHVWVVAVAACEVIIRGRSSKFD